jgi:hypothetical protein
VPTTLIKTVPVLGLPARIGLARDPEDFEPTLAQHKAFEALGDALIDRAAREHRQVDVLDPSQLLCQEKCRVVVDGKLLYSDDNHLTAQGTLLFEPLILSKLTGRP